MPFISRQEPFTCEHCGAKVDPLEHGSCRNHCPRCLWSKHVDVNPGDRGAECQGLMEPVEVEHKSGEYIILHRCRSCGFEKRNKSAKDDDFDAILRLSI